MTRSSVVPERGGARTKTAGGFFGSEVAKRRRAARISARICAILAPSIRAALRAAPRLPFRALSRPQIRSTASAWFSRPGRRGHALDGRSVEDDDHMDDLAQLLLQPVDQHGSRDRVAAQLEEVVVDPDPLRAAAALLHSSARKRSSGVRGATDMRGPPAAATSGSGSALRSTLPLAVSGRAGRTTKAEGTMYSGSVRPPQALAHLGSRLTDSLPATGET